MNQLNNNIFIKKNICPEEINNTILCDSWGICPKLLDHTDSSITMEKYDLNYDEYVRRFKKNFSEINVRVENLLKELHTRGYIHGDIHEENIVIKLDNNNNITDVKLIDFLNLKKIGTFNQEQIIDFCDNDIGIDNYTLDAIYKYEMTIWKHLK
ncbi:serine/threonine protein kinase [Catovirus CTV1]|uniref:Serine/threonine protein kinase n=1 Tax=Catovirus CTV1 TaxID=1977631 RepID=A0A1V0SB61_9VIRU|nr:serine/threonine protein kinase [Catovirus CTV1]